ncbi:MAG TPA: ABC transporter permease [Candidatus Limnocylindria bacterium]|nr:ABC transporter permease [Candidatus Limnocylindria bacterium]
MTLRRLYRDNQRLILGIAGLLSVLIPWELLVRLRLVKAILISSPSQVVQTFITELQLGTLWGDITATLQVWFVGYLLAAVVGIVLGLVAGWFRRASYIANPWLNVLYAAPELAFVPMFILWFGIGFTFKVWLVFLAAIFFITINTIAGVHATEKRYLEVAATFGASKLQIFRTIVLPGSVPYIMTGLRQAAGRALVGVIAAEFISSNQGLGFLITLAGQTLNTSRVMVGIVIIAAFGVFLGEVLRRIESRFDVWRKEATA